MEEVEVTIIGAGVVGLAIAAELAPHRTVYVLERNSTFGQETSSRNSEVIHAGIYYPPGSLKAQLCVEGNRLLYELCARYGINHECLGKLIVAVEEREVPQLQELLENGRQNGVRLEHLLPRQVSQMEPGVRGLAGVFSPSTGILDSHGLMRCYVGMARENHAQFVFGAEVIGLEKQAGGLKVTIRDSTGTSTFLSRVVVNAAGLRCDQVSAMAGIDVDRAGYRLKYCKGEYFSISRRITKRLVYPVPDQADGGLGIHVTPNLEGKVRLGPNARYVDGIDFQVDEGQKEAFYRSVKAFVPSIELDELEPDFAGIRPKLQGPGEAFRDFVIRHEADRGLDGLVDLIGIESPGLTASPAIARYIKTIVDKIL